MFHRAVVQAVLFFRLDLWDMSAAMYITVEGTHTGFLQQIMGNREIQNPDREWVKPVVGEVLGSAGMQSVTLYIGYSHGTLSQWVALRPIFDVCVRDQGYKGGVGDTRGTIHIYQGKLGGDLTGGADKSEQ